MKRLLQSCVFAGGLFEEVTFKEGKGKLKAFVRSRLKIRSHDANKHSMSPLKQRDIAEHSDQSSGMPKEIKCLQRSLKVTKRETSRFLVDTADFRTSILLIYHFVLSFIKKVIRFLSSVTNRLLRLLVPSERQLGSDSLEERPLIITSFAYAQTFDRCFSRYHSVVEIDNFFLLRVGACNLQMQKWLKGNTSQCSPVNKRKISVQCLSCFFVG